MGGKRIDILIIQETKKNVYINIIEIKDDHCKANIFEQLDYYIKWCSEFIVPNYKNKKTHIYGIGFGSKYAQKTKSYKTLMSTYKAKSNPLCEKYYIKEYFINEDDNCLNITSIT